MDICPSPQITPLTSMTIKRLIKRSSRGFQQQPAANEQRLSTKAGSLGREEGIVEPQLHCCMIWGQTSTNYFFSPKYAIDT